MQRIDDGHTVLDPEVVRILLRRAQPVNPLGDLSARELEVLALMAEGHTNSSIGRRLHVTQSAIEKHVNSIFGKLDLVSDGTYSRRVLAILNYLSR